MASQGPLFPSAASDNAGVGTIAWSNVANIEVDDGNVATATLAGATNDTSHLALGTSFGFSIPTGSTINGILVEVKRSATVPGNVQTAGNGVGVTKNGGSNFFTKNPLDAWPLSLTYQSYGASNDLWGTTWTVAQINSSNFGAAIAASATGGSDDTVSIDAIRVTVFYTLPTVFLDWNVPTNQPPTRAKKLVYDHAEGAFMVSPPLVTGWIPSANQPRQDVKPRTYTYPSVSLNDPFAMTLKETTTLDKWAQPTNQPPKLDFKRQQWTYPTTEPFIAYQMIVFVDAIEPPTNQPQMQVKDNRKSWLQSFVDPTFGFSIAPPTVPPMDGWVPSTNQIPGRDLKRWQWLLYQPWIKDTTTPTAAETITIDKWYTSWAQPIQDLKRLQYLHPPVSIDPVAMLAGGGLLDGWIQQTNQPYRVVACPVREGLWKIDLNSLTGSEAVLLDKWAQPTNQPLSLYQVRDNRPRWMVFYTDPTFGWALTFVGFKVCAHSTVSLVTIATGGDTPC